MVASERIRQDVSLIINSIAYVSQLKQKGAIAPFFNINMIATHKADEETLCRRVGQIVQHR